jgi:hypothetical protein
VEKESGENGRKWEPSLEGVSGRKKGKIWGRRNREKMEENGSNLWKGFRGGKKGRFGGGGIGRKWKKMGAIFGRGFGEEKRGEMSIVNSDIDNGEIEIKEEELRGIEVQPATGQGSKHTL